MRMLIVDDNADVRRLIRSVTAAPEDEIEECVDGAEAVAAYRRQRPDIVLMDLRMPRMDGLAATRAIVAQDSSAKILIVTDYDDNILREAAVTAGACDYEIKENLLHLRDKINFLLC